MVLETIAGTALAFSAYQAYDQREQRQAGEARRKKAQDIATAAAASTRRAAEQAARQANLEAPDIDALLENERKRALSGPNATMLTGPGGVDSSSLRLGGVSLLGRP